MELVFGAGARWRLIESEPAPATTPAVVATPAATDEAEAARERAAVASDERVQTVLDIFGGSVAGVEHVESQEGEEDG